MKMEHAVPRKSRWSRRWLLAGALVAVMLGLGGGVLSGGGSAVADSSTIDFNGYSLGSINGQDGWSSTGPYDQAVVTSGGGKALRISNAVTSGAFADQTYSKSLADEAGETSAANDSMSGGSRQPLFDAEFTLSSTVPGSQQPGLSMSVSPDRGDGARMSYLRFEDQGDGIHVFFDDYVDVAPFGTSVGDTNGCDTGDDFNDTDIATLDRSVAHTVKFAIQFVDGTRNDVVKIYLDGNLEATGTSWEDYFRYCEGNPTRTVDSLLFRVGGTAAPANSGFGYFLDDLTLTSAAPPQCSATCYVDAAGGNDANGGTSLSDAKKTIQAAIDQVSAGGDVLVRAGTYDQDEASGRDPNTGGAGLNDFNIFVNKAGITIQGLDGSDNPVTTAPQGATPAQAPLIRAKRDVPTFGSSNIFVQSADVTIRGIQVDSYQSGSPFGVSKAIEVAGDNVTIEDVAFVPYDVSIYLSDFHFGDLGPGVSTLQKYKVKDNTFDGDGFESAVYVASGAGWSGSASNHVISGNELNNLDDGMVFAGPSSGIGWLLYPVGTATISGNTFSQIARRHLLVFGDGGPGVGYADPDWCGIMTGNTFDKGSFLRAGVAPCTPRTWTVAPFTNVAGIYSKIQQYGIGKATAGDTLQVFPGTYNENVVINQDDLTIVGAGIGSTVLQGTACGGTGIAITGNRSNISIKQLTVTGYTYGMTTDNIGSSVNNILIEDVSASVNCVHGIWYQAGVTNNLTLRRVTASNNGGAGGRGFWIINGVKTNVTIEDGTFNNNALVGIDVSDGSVTGLSITGNTVSGNGDSGIGVLGAQGPGANLVFNNVVTNNGRYGIEMKVPTGNSASSGPGSVVVKDNIVSRTVAATDARDYAGIAVFKRSGGPLNASNPSGVVVTGNTVSGFLRKPVGSTGDGFGIVVEGANEVVTKNLVSGNNVGIQIQSGNTADVQSTPAFDRGNGAPSNAAINRNSITGNSDFELRNVGAGLTDATCNWYGTAGGPTTVSGSFTTSPFLGTSNLNGACSSTVVVRPTSLNGWAIVDDQGAGAGSGSFVNGPGTPPLGIGSGRLQLNTAAAGWAFGAGFAGTPLGNLTALSYSTYRSSVDAGNNLAIALQFNVDYDLTDAYTGYQSRIVFEPYQTFGGGVTQNNWQSWNALTGKWWQAAGGSFPARVGGVPVANVCPQASPCTLAALLSAYPNLGIHPTLGAVVLKAGSTWAGFDGNVDNLKIGVNGTDVTYDFEPDCTTDCYVRTDGSDTNSGLANTPADAKKTIQAAVSAVSVGGTVHVAAGTYAEQVVIPKNLSIVGAGVGSTFVKPSGVVANTTRLNGNPTAAIFDIESASSVNISNLTADGSLNGIASCTPDFLGFYFKKSSGQLTNVAASHIRLAPALLGCQSGVGIFAEADSPDVATVGVTNSSVTDYQKGGITGNRTGTTLTVSGSTITGIGPTNMIAANGIQVGFGATGTLTNNNISGNDYTPNTAASTGILLFQASNSGVTGNNIHNNQEGLYVQESDNVTVSTNQFAATRDTAIFVYLSDNGAYSGNTVIGQPASTGMYVYDSSSSNGVIGNAFRSGDFGIIVDFTGAGTPAANSFNNNCLAGNIGAGVETLGTLVGPKVNATSNWWGKVDGPNPPGTGDSIIPGDGSTINVSPFLTAPVAGCPTPGDGDSDTVSDLGDNCPLVANPDQANHDGETRPNGPQLIGDDGTWPMSDLAGDACDLDDDNDGLNDTVEVSGASCGGIVTDPILVDTDGDHLTDGWECSHGSDPTNALSKVMGSGTADADGDRIPDLWEQRGFNSNPGSTDSDGDGCADMVEITSVDGNRAVTDADRLAVARREFGIWGPEVSQDNVLDMDRNGVVGDPDRLLVSRAALLPDWMPKICP